MPLFEKLGVARQMEAIGIDKWGATFVSPWHDKTSSFAFGDALDPTLPKAYQVRRSEFDEILFRRAAEAGAVTIENCRVREIDLGDRERRPRVGATDAAGNAREWRPKFVVDATGRDTLIGNRLKVKRRNPAHNSSAMYGHFRNAKRECGRDEGNIILFWFDHGWFWFIPLKDGTTSVGAVVWPYYMKARNKPLREYFLDTIALSPGLQARLADAELVAEPEATGNYSYQCDVCQGENFIMVGDSYVFVDPVLSSGVLLAMNGGFAGTDVVHARLAADKAAEAAARKRFERVMRHGPREFSWFIYRVTNPTAARALHDAERQVPDEGGAAVGSRGRLVPRHAHQAGTLLLQGRLLRVLDRQPAAHLQRLAPPRLQHPGRFRDATVARVMA